MRHSPARRSFLARMGDRVRLTDRSGSRQRHEHAIAFPARWSGRRLWRLAMAVGLAGAGFCLVLAMVVLVVALGGGASTRPPPRATRTSTSPSELSGRGHRYRTTIVYEPRPVAGNGSASAVRYGLGLLVAQFRGAGSVRGDTFRITRPGDWGISWQFRCTKGRPGNLTIDADDSAAGGGHGEGLGRILGKGNGKEPPGQAKKHKKHKKHEKKVPPGQAKKHKKKAPPGHGKKAIRSKNHSKQARGTGGQPGTARRRRPEQPRHAHSERLRRTRHVLVHQRSRRSHARGHLQLYLGNQGRAAQALARPISRRSDPWSGCASARRSRPCRSPAARRPRAWRLPHRAGSARSPARRSRHRSR